MRFSFRMKATIDIPDELYRKVKAKGALQGRPVREVTEQLLRNWLTEPEARPGGGKQTRSRDGNTRPPWFGALRAYARNARGRHDMEAIRKSIAHARIAESTTKRDDQE